MDKTVSYAKLSSRLKPSHRKTREASVPVQPVSSSVLNVDNAFYYGMAAKRHAGTNYMLSAFAETICIHVKRAVLWRHIFHTG